MTWTYRAFPPHLIEFDWRSGLWECTPAATIELGWGGFGGWVADFIEPERV